MRTVVALYSKTDAIVRPWLDVGFHAVLVDLQHPAGEHTEGNVTRIGADMLEWVPPLWLAQSGVHFVAAFPPCDHLAVSGARWFAGKGLGKLAHSISLFERAAFWCEWFAAPYFIENPVSTISSYWRKPDHTFHPHQFTGFERGDHYTKKTCLWTGGGFNMPASFSAPDLVGVEPDDRIHKAAPSDERANFRSATPMGFSRAVFEANFDPETIDPIDLDKATRRAVDEAVDWDRAFGAGAA
jgi:hypothetical protein